MTSERAQQVRQVIVSILHRRKCGEVLSDEKVIAERPDLMPELGEDLKLLRELSDGPSNAQAESGPAASPQLAKSSRVLFIRCPHCHQSEGAFADTSFTDITCSHCGNQFSLVGEATQTGAAETLMRLGHFELVERLGLGSFGTVWKARDTKLDRTVAIKIPREGRLDEGETEKFLREARAAAQLNHPHIVTVHEVGREDNTVYIVSDLVRGVTLSDWLMGRRPTFQEAAALCAKIADALQHAHESGVIHRDLKPQNIMLDEKNEPHLMDFGLARRDAGEVTMTIEGRVLGTPAYMSPEQARGEAHEVNRQTDVYSLGVILFELLTGG